MTLPERLRATRQSCGISAQRVADDLRVSLKTVQRWESGEHGIHQLRRRAVQTWIRKHTKGEK